MIDNKSIIILKSFSAEMLKKFKIYLESPYFNSRKTLIDLYNAVILYYPDFGIELESFYITNKKTLPAIYSDKKHLIKMLSFLYKELENFIILEENMKSEIKSDLNLLNYYKDNNINSLYHDTHKKIKQKIDFSKSVSIENFIANEIDCTFQSKNDERKGDINYLPTIEKLDLFYYYQKYKILCLMVNRNRITPCNYSAYYNKYDLNINSDILVNKSINLFYNMYRLISVENSSINSFNVLYENINKLKNEIEFEDLSILYVLLSNYCKIIFTDKKDYYKILHSLFKDQLIAGTLYINSKLHISYLRNIVILSLYNKEFDWAIDFLEKNKNNIIPEEQENESYHYLMSEIFFAKKDFDQALENLSKTKSSDNLIKLSIKRLYLKIFFEKEEINTFDSFTNSYKVFLSRDESLTEEKREAERNFVNNMILIQKYKLSNSKNKLKSLLEKIEQENVSDKIYLIEQINSNTK